MVLCVLFECRPGSLDVFPKLSPATPRAARKLKTPGSDPDSFSSPKSKTPKDMSPKVVGKSPRSPAMEVRIPFDSSIQISSTTDMFSFD